MTLPDVGRRCYGAYVAVVIALLAFVNGHVTYYQQYGLAPYDLALMGAAAAAGIVAAAVVVRARRPLSRILASRGAFAAMVAIGTLALVGAQLLIISGAWFETGWDVAMLTDFHGRAAQAEYLSTYPNQWFLAGLFSLAGPLAEQAGVEPYLAFTVAGALGVAASVGATAYIGRALAGPVAGACAFAAAWVLLGLNPNILVPYSDAYGMLCPTVVLFAYTVVRSRPLRWALIPFATYVGYCIKPTAVFAAAAIVAVEGVAALGRIRHRRAAALSPGRHFRTGPGALAARRAEGARRSLACALLGALSLAVALAVVGAVERQAVFEVDENRAVGIPHYLMMGFNEEYNGVYSPDDFAFTASFPTVGERTEANLSVWWDRVVGMGPVGIGKLFAKKAMLSYGEGAFTWRDWYFERVHGDNALIRSLYGIPDAQQAPSKLKPDDVVPWAWGAQVIWFGALIGIVLACAARRADRREAAVCCALLMLSAFLLVFECRARYLFLFGPWFVVLGAIGWRRAAAAVLRRRRG